MWHFPMLGPSVYLLAIRCVWALASFRVTGLRRSGRSREGKKRDFWELRAEKGKGRKHIDQRWWERWGLQSPVLKATSLSQQAQEIKWQQGLCGIAGHKVLSQRGHLVAACQQVVNKPWCWASEESEQPLIRFHSEFKTSFFFFLHQRSLLPSLLRSYVLERPDWSEKQEKQERRQHLCQIQARSSK